MIKIVIEEEVLFFSKIEKQTDIIKLVFIGYLVFSKINFIKIKVRYFFVLAIKKDALVTI